ncbi:MAG TPA: aminotransferase class V-fold PLP-dependent enzyme, partial [Spirochaetota bacterium]|nr:aminotransferase class V-fold PLP-dependent enzyme [Spirochaetota bacterium]
MIYLDNNATTPLHPKVKEKIIEFLDYYGNPSSAHEFGRFVRFQIEEARKEIATFFNCFPEELVFTASGSEANNTVLKSFATCCGAKDCGHKVNIISTVIEHPSVKNTLKCLESQNVEITYLGVDQNGMVNPDDLRK